jgi:hypothetical protein
MIQKTTVMDWTLTPRQCCEWISGDDVVGCEETVTRQQMVLENLDAAGSGVQYHVSCFHVWRLSANCVDRGNRLTSAEMPPMDHGPVNLHQWLSDAHRDRPTDGPVQNARSKR